MTQETRKAGYYELLSAKLYKLDQPNEFIDIKLLIYSWTLNESLNDGFLYGSIEILDGTGLFYNFLNTGLRGEEEIEIAYKDYYDEERKHKFFVYSISDIKPVNSNNETAINYKMHFVSKNKFYTDRFDIRKSYTGDLISNYVEAMWEEFWIENDDSKKLTRDDIEIEETEGLQDLYIPNYRPEQAMHMMARKAYSGDNLTSTFRFFENRDKYYFMTNEQLIFDAQGEEIVKFAHIQNPDQTTVGQDFKMINYIDINFSDHVNTIRDMVEGAYYRSTTELDFMNRTTLVTEYRYLDDYENYILPDYTNTRSKHTKEFVDKHFNNFSDTLVLKDYPAIGSERGDFFVRPHTYYNQIYNKKPVNFYHHSTESVEMTVYGRNSMVAGDVVELEILKMIGNLNGSPREIDTERSGKYLIESIENIFLEDMYYQKLIMSKSGIQGKPEPAREYEREPQTISEFLEDKRDTFELIGEPPQSSPAAGNAGGGSGTAGGSGSTNPNLEPARDQDGNLIPLEGETVSDYNDRVKADSPAAEFNGYSDRDVDDIISGNDQRIYDPIQGDFKYPSNVTSVTDTDGPI